MAELDAKRTTVSANIQDAEKRLEALKVVDAETELRQLREKVAQLQGQLEGVKPALAEGPASKRTLQARRFRSQLRGRVAGVDRRTTGRSARSNVVGETRRGREDQHHHGPCSTTVATRSRSWDDAIDGDEHNELRSTYGLRGVRVGEASHPGPVQTRNARRLQSLLVDSEACTVDQSTLVDPDDDSLARSRVSRHPRFRSRGERIQVSSDDEVPHTVRASTRALRDAGIASFISEADPTQLDPSDCHSLMEHEQRGPDEVSAGAHSVSEVLGDLPSGRFAALAKVETRVLLPTCAVHRRMLYTTSAWQCRPLQLLLRRRGCG